MRHAALAFIVTASLIGTVPVHAQPGSTVLDGRTTQAVPAPGTASPGVVAPGAVDPATRPAMPDSTATRYSSEAAQPVESWGNADRRSWLSMPFPLVLWLLIAPLILVVGSSGFGSSRSQTYSDRARVDDRGEVKPGFGTLPRR